MSYQPDEHVFQPGLSHLLELRRACEEMAARPRMKVHNDFVIFPLRD